MSRNHGQTARSGGPPVGRRRRGPRPIEILALAALASFGVLFVFVVGGLTDRRMQALKAEAVAVLESHLGRRVSYDSLSPSVFGFLALRNLAVYSIEDPGAVLLRVSRLKVRYNLLRFALTHDPVGALTRIQIANSSFDVDHERDRELIEVLSRLGGSRVSPGDEAPGGEAPGGEAPGGEAPLRPALALEISGSNIEVRYRRGGWSVGVSNLFFSLRPEAEGYQVAVRGTLEAARTNGPGGAPSTAVPQRVRSRLKLTGSVGADLSRTDLAVRVYTLATATVELKRQTFQVSYDAGTLRIRKVQDRSPLDLQLLLEAPERRLTAQFVAEGLRPASLLRFEGALARLDPLLAGTLSGRGELSVDLERGQTRYSAALDVSAPPGFLPLPARLEGRVSGNERLLYLRPLTLHANGGRAEFRGNLLLGSFLPEGVLRFEEFEPVPGRSLEATLRVERAAQGVTLSGEALQVAGAQLDALRLTAMPSRTGAAFSLSADLAAPLSAPAAGEGQAAGEPQARGGEIQLGGRVGWSPRPWLEVAGNAARLPLGTLYGWVVDPRRQRPALRRTLADYSLSLAAEAETDFGGFRVSAESVEVRQVSKPGNAVSFAAEVDDRSLSVRAASARWADYSLRGELGGSLDEQGAGLQARVWLEQTPYELTARWEREGRVRVSGSYGLSGSLDLDGWGNPVFSANHAVPMRGRPFTLSSQDLPVPVRGAELLLSLDLEGLVGFDGALYALSQGSTVRFTPAPGGPGARFPAGSLEMAFLLRDRHIAFSRLSYRDRVSALEGSGEATVRSLLPPALSGSVQLAAADSPERYDVRCDLEWPRVEGTLQLLRAPLARLGSSAVTGDLSGTLSVAGSWPEPEVHTSLRLEDGRLNVDPLDVELSAGYAQRRISLEALRLRFLSHRVQSGEGFFDLQQGQFQLRLPYRGEYFGQVVELTGELQGRTLPEGQAVALRGLSQSSLEADMRLADIRIDGEPRPEWRLRAQSADGRTRLAGGPGGSLGVDVLRDGSFSLQLGSALPVQGAVEGRLSQGRIEADCRVDTLDMRVLNTLLAKAADIIRFNTGQARGSLRFSGPINDPDWSGALDISATQLTFIPSPDPVGPIDTQLIFEEKAFYLPRTATYSGRSPIEAEGTFYLDHWVPEAIELFFYAERAPGVRIRHTFGPVYTDGYATGALRVRSDRGTTLIQGKVTADACRFALQREETPAEGPPGASLSVDMKIKTGRTVEFYWPGLNFPVLRAYARQGEEVSLALDGETGEFSLLGDVQTRGGEIFYFDRSFYLKEGSIAFEESAVDLDPWIKAVAEVRERDIENRDVTIYLEADNKLSKFSPRFYSVPSLSDVEILDMIGGTIFNRFEQTDFGTAAVMLTSDIVSQFGILSPFERAVRQVLRLDLFSMRTQFLQNVLLGRLRGEEPGGLPLNPLDNTTLSLGKYLGTDLFLEALVRFEAVEDINRESGNVRTEGELNLEWATPFFLLEWTFAPMHPENLFVSDNSIGISWKFSY